MCGPGGPVLWKGPECHTSEPEGHTVSFSRVNIWTEANSSLGSALGLAGFPEATPAPSFSAWLSSVGQEKPCASQL